MVSDTTVKHRLLHQGNFQNSLQFEISKFFLLARVTQNGHSLDCCSSSDSFQGFLKQLLKLTEVGSA